MGALEDRIGAPEDERQRIALREFLSRLTHEELEWLAEPGERAAALVPCLEHPEHGCACPDRERRGYEADPALREEQERRWAVLYKRREEIMEREPARTGAPPEGIRRPGNPHARTPTGRRR